MSSENVGINPMSVAEVLAWLAEILDERQENITVNTSRGDIPTWDSLGQLVLMSGLDERFGVQLTDQELSRLNSIGDVLELLHGKGRIKP